MDEILWAFRLRRKEQEGEGRFGSVATQNGNVLMLHPILARCKSFNP